MASSFHRRGKPVSRIIPGIKLSPYNAETVLSCGIATLDYVLGGGLPLGSILLAEEDAFATYCKQLLKYYVAEGIEQRHVVFLASGETDPVKFLKELPKAVYGAADPTTKTVAASCGEGDGDLKIAFRYQHMPQQEPLPDQRNVDHIFDFAERIESTKLADAQITTFEPCVERKVSGVRRSTAAPLAGAYASVLGEIYQVLEKSKASDGTVQNAVRIILCGLGSPAWGNEQCLPAFLHALKCLTRGEHASVFVTVPPILAQHQPSVFLRCRRSADIVLKMQSFDDAERGANPLYKSYHGLLQVVKLSRTSSLSVRMPDCDFLFHQRSKKFVLEKLHMPPELGGSKDDHHEGAGAKGMACASNQKFGF
uniref:Elongator complex protein 4 n=1 Tax=Ixodes ricinus TaxID=34613 RepID=A0A131Y313_IXORI